MQLKEKRPPRHSIRKTLDIHEKLDAAEPAYIQKEKHRRYSWVWNVPLLLLTIAILTAGGGAVTGLYLWQSHRLRGEMLNRAAAAESVKDYKTQAKWLGRYVRMEPDNTEALIQLAIATDNGVKSVADLHRARRSLSNAIAAIGQMSAFNAQESDLRRRLIKRLLKLGGYYSAEAERQVILLSAPNEDPEALSWLGQAIANQYQNKMGGQRKGSKLDKSQDYWRWMAEQPVGYVVREALKHNPQDVDMAGIFLTAMIETPRWFEGGPEATSQKQLQQEAEDACQRLVGMQDNGQAQLIAYFYRANSKQDAAAAQAQLDAAQASALARLAENLKDDQDAAVADDESEPAVLHDDAALFLNEQAYNPYWDWQLVLLAAGRAMAESRYTDAQAIFQQLIGLASPAVKTVQLETTFMNAGQAYLKSQAPEKALEVWTAGIEAVPESIELSMALASTFTELQKTEEAQAALAKAETYITQQLSRLDGSQGTTLSVTVRKQVRRRLEYARWRSQVLSGTVHMQRGDYRAASDLLIKAFQSPLAVETDDLIQSGRVLAECYGKQQLWDLAGQTLDRCISMRPTDVSLRRLAANAWYLSGSPERATMQVDALDDGSFGAALDIARMKATAESAKPRGQRDPASVRKAVHVARLRWESLSAKEQAGQPLWMLEILEAAHPEKEADDPQQHHQRLKGLADRWASIPEVQMLAGFNLAAPETMPDAKEALQRLQKIAEVSGKSSDAANALLVETKIIEATDGVEPALNVLRRAMPTLPDEAPRLAKAGASLALLHKQTETAYELLKTIPEKDWDVEALTMAGRMATRSGDVAVGLPIADADVARWESRLRQLEGEDGCNWRYLAAQRLLQSASRRTDRAELLGQAQKYFEEIDSLRPRWGMGAALGGQIAALKGSHNEAIALLRRAIHDGDGQTSTVVALASELTAAGQFEQAEQELKRLAAMPESLVPTSRMEILLARRKGDLRTALDLARKATTRSRNDATSWLVAFQTAMALSRSRDVSPEEKTMLRSESWDALEQATRLTEGKDLNVWNARFRFHLEAGDKDKAKQELAALQASAVPRNSSLVATAAGFLELQEFETAQARAKEATALDPSSPQPRVVMARIMERIGDRQGALSELQAAHRLDSKSVDIRERLAIAYVLGSDDIPWSEVDRLLSDNADSARSLLLRAVLSLKRGDEGRIQLALASLRTIAEADDPESPTAKRILAKHAAQEWLQADAEEREALVGRKYLQQARTLYEDLLRREPPAPADGIAFAALLIEAGQLDEAKQVVDQLSSAGTSPLVLQLRLKIARLQGEDVSSVASAWMASATGYEEEQLWEMVGRTMSQLDFNEEALEWLEKTYQKDSTRLIPYAIGLAKVGQTDKAISLCVSRIEQDGSLEAATLLPEIVLLNTTGSRSEMVEQALAGAIKQHSDSAPLLEAVATLRLLQERYAESVALYEQADKLDPNRPRTLNNLAIAMVELPMRKNAALEKINKAIQLYGKHPQFLDTLAMVQSKLGQHENAKATLEEVLAREQDPRSQMRLVEELIALGDQTQAQSVWEQIGLEKLKAMTLTPGEQRSFTKLSQELGNHE